MMYTSENTGQTKIFYISDTTMRIAINVGRQMSYFVRLLPMKSYDLLFDDVFLQNLVAN